MTRKKNMLKENSEGTKDLTKQIKKLFSKNPSKTWNYKQVSACLHINEAKNRRLVQKKIAFLKEKGQIKEVKKGTYTNNQTKKYHRGILDVTSNGNAYFICDDLEEDVFISSNHLNKAFDKDTVEVFIFNHRKKKKKEGEVVAVVQRFKTAFVGILQTSKNFGFVIPDNNKIYADIFVSKENFREAKNGDKVLVSLEDWPENSKNPFGKIVQVLGKPGEHQTEIHSILAAYELPYAFPEEVEKEANELDTSIGVNELKKRRDMRAELTFTIDPKDAKDFDDALSFNLMDNGHYEVGIHIADVSHYISLASELEKEAYHRATSVYLVDRVVPMLPEVLSNGVCSLRPNEDKLTFSAVFELDENATLVNQWFGRTVIHSDQRFAYEEAQFVIENGKINTPISIPDDVSIRNKGYEISNALVNAVLQLNALAKKMRDKRMKNGAISFDKVEVKFNLDQEANPLGVFFKESKEANKLIEEFMLLANRKVSEFVSKKREKTSRRTFVYRIHDEPDYEKLKSLQDIVSKFGYRLDLNTKATTTQTLNRLLKEVHGKPEANMIETLAIRSMSKAEYSTENIGHYGLSFDYYSHFTSPIRRYPDVMVHRLLQHYLDGGNSPNRALYEEKCKHASEREYLATKAERDSVKYMQIKYMQNHQEKKYLGVISGVTDWGIYVEIIENKCEGMVRTRDLKDDHYTFDEKQYALVGHFTKKKYQLGDEVSVKVKKADLDRKHLDFTLLT